MEGLLKLISLRLSIPLIFATEKVARFLAEKSGGSVRDLIRLLDEAQLEARVDDKSCVDMISARAAVKKLSVTFIRLLLPGSVYYPILAEVHKTKCEFELPAGEATTERVAAARSFFGELVSNGIVLEYNGADSWYDVHPAVCEIGPFSHACKVITSAQP